MPKYHTWSPYKNTSNSPPIQTHLDIDRLLSTTGPSPTRSRVPYPDPSLPELIKSLSQAITQNQSILLYGDYDVDGTMSCVLWIWYFQLIGFTNFKWYIPTRNGGGYGVHIDVLEEFHHRSPLSMVITMDTGITAKSQVQWCAERNITTVITDHHDILPDQLPEHGFIINPKMFPSPDTSYKYLCGCGVTLLIITSLARLRRVDLSPWLSDGLAITALATICDMVPLIGDNRELVRRGLASFQNSQRGVLAALRRYALATSKNPQPQLSSDDFAFKIGPLINAVGRLGDASAVVATFIDTDPHADWHSKIDDLKKFRTERRDIDEAIMAQAQQIAEQKLTEDPHLPVLFIGDEGWHSGVLGLIAGRLVEKYRLPAWVFTIDPKTGEARGSVRSFSENSLGETLPVTQAMEAAGQLFTRFGGHKVAAGFSFETSQQSAIEQHLTRWCSEYRDHHPQLWQGQRDYWGVMPLNLLTPRAAHIIEQHEPFGSGAPRPEFIIEGVLDDIKIYASKDTGEPKHTAVFLKENPARDHSRAYHQRNNQQRNNQQHNYEPNSRHRVMFFGEVLDQLSGRCGDPLQCLVRLQSSWFRGEERVDLLGVDYRFEIPTDFVAVAPLAPPPAAHITQRPA